MINSEVSAENGKFSEISTPREENSMTAIGNVGYSFMQR